MVLAKRLFMRIKRVRPVSDAKLDGMVPVKPLNERSNSVMPLFAQITPPSKRADRGAADLEVVHTVVSPPNCTSSWSLRAHHSSSL
jgi:hypothetical protein